MKVTIRPRRRTCGSAPPRSDEALWIEYELGRVYKLHEMRVWNYNVQFELVLGFGLKDVTIEYSTDGVDWITLGDVQLAQGTAMPDYARPTRWSISRGSRPATSA